MTRARSWAIGVSVLLILVILAAVNLGSNDSTTSITAEVYAPAADTSGFARATGPQAFSFPSDFGPHPAYQTEWWYYTGNLESGKGRRFGYELTFFRRALQPADESSGRSSAWAADQIYMGHFALSDAANEDFYYFERFSRGAAGLAGAQASPYAVWLEDWRVEQTTSGTLTLTAASEEIQLELELMDEKGPILQGEQGYSRKGPEPGNASFYYSQTRLASYGRITIAGEAFDVQGLSWKDHEFSTSALSPGQEGWDWFSIQLDNGHELMLYQLRRSDGSVDPFSSGSLILPDGQVLALEHDDFAVEATNSWTSPHTSATYPMNWSLNIPSVELKLDVTPLFEDQELNLSFVYWEGAVDVQATMAGESVSGQGYVEMTGYAQSLEGEF